MRKLFAGTPRRPRCAASRRRTSRSTSSAGAARPARAPGSIEVDMQFMAPVTVACETCQGRRFRPEVLAVRYRGRNIAETLELTVETALEVFADAEARSARRLRMLAEVGLGYLRLGPADLDALRRRGAAAQAGELPRPAGAPRGSGSFLFDEPTTGLHLADIDLLYRTLRRLVQRGDGVVVVEHSLDLIARCRLDRGPRSRRRRARRTTPLLGAARILRPSGQRPDRDRAAALPASGRADERPDGFGTIAAFPEENRDREQLALRAGTRRAAARTARG